MDKVATIQKVSFGLVVLYIIIIAKFMFHGGKPEDVSYMFWLIAGSFFWGWASAPMAAFLFLIFESTAILKKMIFLTFQIIFLIFTTYIYYDAFYVHLDAQNGILFFVLPIWQYIGIGIIIAAMKVVEFILQQSTKL